MKCEALEEGARICHSKYKLSMLKFLDSLFMHPIEITLPLHVLGTVGHLLAVAVPTHGTLPPDQPPQLSPPEPATLPTFYLPPLLRTNINGDI